MTLTRYPRPVIMATINTNAQRNGNNFTKKVNDIFPYIDSMKKIVKKWVKNNPSEVEALKNVLCEINIGTHDFIPIIQ